MPVPSFTSCVALNKLLSCTIVIGLQWDKLLKRTSPSIPVYTSVLFPVFLNGGAGWGGRRAEALAARRPGWMSSLQEELSTDAKTHWLGRGWGVLTRGAEASHKAHILHTMLELPVPHTGTLLASSAQFRTYSNHFDSEPHWFTQHWNSSLLLLPFLKRDL